MSVRSLRSTAKGKGLIRSANRSAVDSGKLSGAARAAPRRLDPVVCERCGAVWSRRTWRNDRAVTTALLSRAQWKLCPACQQADAGSAFGRVLLRGAYVRANEDAIRQRIGNVAARAQHTQPQRRVISIGGDREGLEVLTTSQKLAHRIVHELKKAFRGRASYAWSDRDGALLATWRRDR
jgi:NMD protein affecting ribosome stability and mRNA decay